MVVVMSPDATDDDVAHVVAKVEAVGGEAFVSKGVARTIIGLVGDIDSFHGLNLRTLPGVRTCTASPTPTSGQPPAPPRAVDRLGRAGWATRCRSGPTRSPSSPARARWNPPSRPSKPPDAKSAGATILRGGAFKPRTSRHAFQGLGVGGLKILGDVRAATGLPIVTEVVDAGDVAIVAEYADMLQVGTRNMANFGLLQAVGKQANRCCSSAA